MPLALDAGTIRVHLFDQGTKKSSVGSRHFQRLTRLKGILRYFAELSLLFVLICGRFERWHAFEQIGI